MKVNCCLCGKPREAPDMDDLTLMRISKTVHVPYKETKKTDWKYVCNDCTNTVEYWSWVFTPDAEGHIALTEGANIALVLSLSSGVGLIYF